MKKITESDSNYEDLEKMSVSDLLKNINREDKTVPHSVKNQLPQIEKLINANKRGLLLLDLEEILKSKIDKGVTVWCEPVGDKSVLRKLRGVTIDSK